MNVQQKESGQQSSTDSEAARRSAVFLDRDGVINRMVFDAEFGTVDSPSNPDQMILLPGVPQAIAELNRLGLLVVVVSNQPGLAKAKYTPALLEATKAKMLSEIEVGGGRVDAIYYCLHHPQADLIEYRVNCDCRKPKPGMLLQAGRELEIDLESSYLVGDGVTDIVAGQAAGATTLFVSSRKCYICDSLVEHRARPDYLVKDLSEAAKVIRQLESGEAPAPPRFVSQCAL